MIRPVFFVVLVLMFISCIRKNSNNQQESTKNELDKIQSKLDSIDKLWEKLSEGGYKANIDTLKSDLKAYQSFLNGVPDNENAKIPSICPIYRGDILEEEKNIDGKIKTLIPYRKPSIVGYGKRVHFIYRLHQMHLGIDLACLKGTGIKCTGDGMVDEVENNIMKSQYGKYIIVNHQNGFKSVYAHLDSIFVQKGDILKKNQIIGFTGNSGVSSSPHLHYEVHWNDKPVNPIITFIGDLNEEEIKLFLSENVESYD